LARHAEQTPNGKARSRGSPAPRSVALHGDDKPNERSGARFHFPYAPRATQPRRPATAKTHMRAASTAMVRVREIAEVVAIELWPSCQLISSGQARSQNNSAAPDGAATTASEAEASRDKVRSGGTHDECSPALRAGCAPAGKVLASLGHPPREGLLKGQR
jgi:hypothetical protein